MAEEQNKPNDGVEPEINAAGEEQSTPAEQDDTPVTEEALAEQLAQALEQIEQQKDAALRAQAELMNVRRRAERDVEHAHKFGMEKITQELLPVVDNLERALEAASGDQDFVKALREGVELTLSMFLKALAKFQIEPVNPEGEPFDPGLHQAVSMIEQNQVEPNTVVHVMQKGYTLHGRIVRPAMVVVSKPSEDAAPKIDEQA